MRIIQIKRVNGINWIILLFCLLVTIFVLYFNIYTFVPSTVTFIGAILISGLYMLNMLTASTLLWLNKLYPPKYKEKLSVKDVFKHFDNNLGLSFVFILIAGLFLTITLIFAVSGFYTNILGENIERTEVVLYKVAHTSKRGPRGASGKSGLYSVKLTNIDKSINISVSDYYLLQKGRKVKITGKKSVLGLLINEFSRI